MEQETPIRKRIIRFLIAWVFFAVILAIVLYIDTYPEFPGNLSRLLVVFLIGIPVWMIVNLAAERYVGRAFKKVGENRLRTINKVLAGIIIVPIMIVLVIALVMTLLGK